MSEPNIVHVVLTRFNVQLSKVKRNQSDEWLRERMELFEDICMPSVQAQSVPCDSWFVFFDVDSPQFLKSAVTRWAEASNLIPVYCKRVDAALACQAIEANCSKENSWLVTTRLDNDDGINRRFFECIRGAVRVGVTEFLNPSHGLVVKNDRFYRKRDLSSPFISLSEPLSECDTVWKVPHHKAKSYKPVRQLHLRDAWVQVIHGRNIANRVRGVRARANSIDRSNLPQGLTSRLREEGTCEYWVDNSIGLVRRYCLSALRYARVKILSG